MNNIYAIQVVIESGFLALGSETVLLSSRLILITLVGVVLCWCSLVVFIFSGVGCGFLIGCGIVFVVVCTLRFSSQWVIVVNFLQV